MGVHTCKRNSTLLTFHFSSPWQQSDCTACAPYGQPDVNCTFCTCGTLFTGPTCKGRCALFGGEGEIQGRGRVSVPYLEVEGEDGRVSVPYEGEIR